MKQTVVAPRIQALLEQSFPIGLTVDEIRAALFVPANSTTEPPTPESDASEPMVRNCLDFLMGQGLAQKGPPAIVVHKGKRALRYFKGGVEIPADPTPEPKPVVESGPVQA